MTCWMHLIYWTMMKEAAAQPHPQMNQNGNAPKVFALNGHFSDRSNQHSKHCHFLLVKMFNSL